MSENTKVEIDTEATEAAAAKALRYFSVDTKSAYNRAKSLHASVNEGRGITADAMAASLTRLRIAQLFPGLSPEEAEAEHNLLTSRAKVSITGQTVRNYLQSWESPVNAGILPDEETVAAAYKVISRGKFAKVRKEQEALIAESENDRDTKRSDYLKLMRLSVLSELAPAGTPRNPGGKAPAEPQTIEGLIERDGLTVEAVVSFMKAILSADFDESERAEVAVHLAATIETLSEVSETVAA
jgi:hypothetical protein